MTNSRENLPSLNDLASSIKDALEFRARNVFFSSFFIAWISVNWEVLFYFILSDDSVLIKIKNINTDSFLPLTSWLATHTLEPRLAVPLIISLGVTLLYPLFSLAVIFLHSKIISKIDAATATRDGNREKIIQKNKALLDMEIQQYKEDCIKSKYVVEDILKLKAKNESQILKLEQDKISLNAFIDEQNKRKDDLTSELQVLNELLAIPRQRHEEYKKILDSSSSLNIELIQMKHDLESKTSEVFQLNERLRFRDGDYSLLLENREEIVGIINQAMSHVSLAMEEFKNTHSDINNKNTKIHEHLSLLLQILTPDSIPQYRTFEGL